MPDDPMSIRQQRVDWCIPATVEFVGKHSGLYPQHDQKSLVAAGVGGTFDTVPPALAGISDHLEAEHVDTMDFDDWKAKVEASCAAGDYVIVSIPNPIGPHPVTGQPWQTWHMRVVLECTEDGIRVFDPLTGEDQVSWNLAKERRENHAGGTDLLLVRRKAR